MADDRILGPHSRCCYLDEHIWWSCDSDHAEHFDVGTHSCFDCNHWWVELLVALLEPMLISDKQYSECCHHTFQWRMHYSIWRVPSGLLRLWQRFSVRQTQTTVVFVSYADALWYKRLTLVDVDAPIRLSEEAQDAAVTVPKATMHTQLISCICGLIVSYSVKI